MKKISIILACAALALGFSSCEQDTDPKYQVPTKFVLNTPVFQDQYYELSPEHTFNLDCSQPDYGYSAVAKYSAEVSLTEDFNEYLPLPNTDATNSFMTILDNELSVALCQLHGFLTPEDYVEQPAGPIYLRAVCQLDGVESSLIKSNVVSLNNVKFYWAEKKPGFIFLVGKPEGWVGPTDGNASHYEDWKLYEAEDAIGSKVYTGTFPVNAGEAMFRFYTALTGWDDDSYGSQEADSALDFEMVNGSFSGKIVKGKGSFNFPAWEGGKMNITVDMSDESNMILTVKEVE